MLLVTVVAVGWVVAWHVTRDDVRIAEVDRERGRVWAMACIATHRAVQAGLVASQRQVTPNELRQPGSPYQPFLPAGVAPVDKVGAGQIEGRYGAVMVAGVPMAVCSLSGPDMEFRYPALREGALSGGLERVAVVGRGDTLLHDHETVTQAVLGSLDPGSMFATADLGIGHPGERLHRRLVGGRPEFQSMERGLEFTGGSRLLGAERVDGQRAEVITGTYTGTNVADVTGSVVVGATGRLRLDSASTGLTAREGFQFGPRTAPHSVPQLLSVGTSVPSGNALVVRGPVSAGSMTINGIAEAGGELEAGHVVSSGNVTIAEALTARRLEGSQEIRAGGRLIADGGTVTGLLEGGALRTGSLTATGRVTVTGQYESKGPITATGTVGGGSLGTSGHVLGNSGGFGSLVVGSCDGCGPTL